MSFHVFCYVGRNEQNEQNEKVANHLAITRWLNKTTALPRQIEILPPSLGKKSAVSFQSIFESMFFFLFHIPIIIIIPIGILSILIPEEAKKTRS